MTSTRPRALAALCAEAVIDAVRRRSVPVILVISLLSLFAIESCTSCGAAPVYRAGEITGSFDVAVWGGAGLIVLVGLWILVLAGVLASDHLVSTLEDGSAAISLSRPVTRNAFAAARLVGALSVALATGAILIGATALLLRMRHGIPVTPALWSGLGCVAGALTVASLAMAASLCVNRMAAALLVVALVGGSAALELAAAIGGAPSGWVGVVHRYGPPLAVSLAAPLAPWLGSEANPLGAAHVALRAALWAVAAPSALLALFGRSEIGG